MESPASIDSIPNEILITILSLFPTRALLPLVAVSRHFNSVTVRIVRHRMKQATALPDYRLILECYHPSAKISTPYLYGDYLSTDSLEDDDDDESLAGRSEPGHLPEPTIGRLRDIYSHFRPVVQEENRRARSRYLSQSQPDVDSRPPSHDIYLDENELFSQLCTVTNLVKVGPKPGLFLSHVNVSDAVIRVWRGWLATQVALPEDWQKPVLWADASRDVGLRFRVTEREVNKSLPPVLFSFDDEPPVAYRLEFEELLVRTGRLLLTVEKSEAQEVATSGKAIVIASI
ncbi:hypothetical protein B0H63DRAFT_492715 [Podospora didyma]|uniref:F-box domain-containing protein n=1 Tax=Podospora didyma TaxID=330526 RepID=A0AAE0U4D2_9PEZI|nr:hypothetical protein B0H63DRAFT_492715 [Podospora didyma]